MGFNIRYLPSLKELKKTYDRDGHEEFVRSYKRTEAFIGPSQSINFVQKMINKKQKTK